jgi:hypothetical protein
MILLLVGELLWLTLGDLVFILTGIFLVFALLVMIAGSIKDSFDSD